MNRGIAYCSGPITHRAAVKLGSLALGALGLGDVYRLQSQAATIAGRRRSAIF